MARPPRPAPSPLPRAPGTAPLSPPGLPEALVGLRRPRPSLRPRAPCQPRQLDPATKLASARLGQALLAWLTSTPTVPPPVELPDSGSSLARSRTPAGPAQSAGRRAPVALLAPEALPPARRLLRPSAQVGTAAMARTAAKEEASWAPEPRAAALAAPDGPTRPQMQLQAAAGPRRSWRSLRWAAISAARLVQQDLLRRRHFWQTATRRTGDLLHRVAQLLPQVRPHGWLSTKATRRRRHLGHLPARPSRSSGARGSSSPSATSTEESQ
mmetsp:Transcript_73203/g.163863  ORF Transcript_73203/g.163863 Transcript_73203/m.163863 type:complete len:269 (-) Transcript_73203:462-1268(-)